jgi:peptide deformylase
MPKLLQISQLGNQILRKKAEEIKNINDFAIQELIDDMIQTCQDADGVGIAASQVYQSLRLFIVMFPDVGIMIIINPTIISTSNEKEKDWEGCLSVPGIRGQVLRHKSVTVSFTNRQGQLEERTLDNFVARIFQHEYDHIDGIIFTDRVDSKDLVTEKEYKKITHASLKK